jgi:SAM-dependent methyltransferase
MKKQAKIAAINEQHWEKMVHEGCGFTLPWLNLNRNLIQKYINGQLVPVPEPLIDIYPADILQNIQGKDVLCLASGGGQQSVIFGLLGAQVTVVDLSEGQLTGDQKAAAHYGYKVSTIKTDMRNLSPLKDNYFDLVYQAPSMAYIPDVHEVYSEVVRILRKGGLYRVNFSNPATEFVDCEDWDGKGYRITRPYTERIRKTNNSGDHVIEFKHFLSDIFNGLIESGMIIQQVQEAPYFLRQNTELRPGSWEHWLTYIAGFAIVARKG